MDNTTIRQTKARGMDAYSITIGKTSYYFIYSSELYDMPKIIQVTIAGVDIPVDYEVSDVVQYATSYALGVEEGKLSGILVCIEKVTKKTFPVRGVFNAIDDAIEQAMNKGCFKHEWRRLSFEEMETLVKNITSHSQTIKS